MTARKKRSAEQLGKQQREISISEFFAKNRHLLGFDNPRRALLTSVKEAVDNSLDACEEGGILPEIKVIIEQLSEKRFTMIVEDNGPGIVKDQIPKIFAKLLYGSKFHRLRMSRGQQGIGISAAGMYGQITTGAPVKIISKTGPRKKAHLYELQIDTVRNRPNIIRDETIDWDGKKSGVRIEIMMEGSYNKGKQSLDEYVKQTAIANPHVHLEYTSPLETEPVVYSRAIKELPAEPAEIKPHPYGVELGMLMKMLANSEKKNIKASLMNDFCRVGPTVAANICKLAGVSPRAYTKRIVKDEIEKIYDAIQKTKIMNPPTNCIVPIGEETILKGLRKEIQADFYTSHTRPPAVYRGNPFQVEVGFAYGGNQSAEDAVEILRFANRVPLLYQKGGCAISEAVQGTNWRNYGLRHSNGAYPIAPMTVFVHIASVWVPFTSESKEAIAHYPEIIREIKAALQRCGRDVATFVKKRKRALEAERKKKFIEKYIPHIGIALRQLLDLSENQEEEIVVKIQDTLRGRSIDG